MSFPGTQSRLNPVRVYLIISAPSVTVVMLIACFIISDIAPVKSLLKPPKLAPSAWQLYFTDWIQRHQATSTRKLNVAQAAKEAGQEYANLTAAEKEVCYCAIAPWELPLI